MRRTRHAHDSITELEGLLAGMESVENPLSRLATIERRQGGVAYEFEGPKTRGEHLEVLESLSRRLWHMATAVVAEKLRARILMQPDGGASDLQSLNAYRRLIDLPEPDLDAPFDLDELSDLDDSFWEDLFDIGLEHDDGFASAGIPQVFGIDDDDHS